MPGQLLDLPHELLSYIALHLYDPQNLDDLKHLRLVSRACQDIGIEYLFAYQFLDFQNVHHMMTQPLAGVRIRGACRELHLQWRKEVAPRLGQPAWLKGLEHIQDTFPAVIHLQVVGTGYIEATYMLRHLLARSPLHRSLRISIDRHQYTPTIITSETIIDTSMSLPHLTYLKVEGRACQILLRTIANSGSSVFPGLTSLSIGDDPSAETQQIAVFAKACPTVTKLSIDGCPSLHLVPLLSIIEAHLDDSLVSLRIVRWEAKELDPPTAGFAFAKLEALSIEDGSDKPDDDDDGLNLSEISTIVAATVRIVTAIRCPTLVHFNLQWRSIEADEPTSLSLRDHLSCAKRFPALRLLYSRPAQDRRTDGNTSNVAMWRAAEAASQYTILWGQTLQQITDIFGAGRQPCV